MYGCSVSASTPEAYASRSGISYIRGKLTVTCNTVYGPTTQDNIVMTEKKIIEADGSGYYEPVDTNQNEKVGSTVIYSFYQCLPGEASRWRTRGEVYYTHGSFPGHKGPTTSGTVYLTCPTNPYSLSPTALVADVDEELAPDENVPVLPSDLTVVEHSTS